MRTMKFRVYWKFHDGSIMKDEFAFDDVISGGSWLKEKPIIAVVGFTGFLDDENREIYEGDISKVLYGLTIIEWVDDYASFKALRLWDQRFDSIGGVVIGNIYENPELLRDKGRGADER